METRDILKHVDLTLLKAFATWEDIQKLCEEAIQYETASVCVPPSYVGRIHEKYGEKLNVCTVIGFPLGYSTTGAKVEETRQAIADGANEIDMVINIAEVKNGNYDFVTDEIRSIKKAAGNHILKVIIETCLLNEEEKIKMCEIVTQAKADYIKTSTGFSTGGATFDDIALFAKYVGPDVKIKAAGGISSFDDAEKFISLGASRLGTSRLVKIEKSLS